MKKKTLFVYNLWWAFGSHLLHIKWAKIHAIKNDYEFFYRYNVNRIFPDKTIEYYFEPISTIAESELEPEDLVQYLLIWKELDPWERYAYKPDNFDTVEEFHQSVLQEFYRPNQRVKQIINNNKIIQTVRDIRLRSPISTVCLTDFGLTSSVSAKRETNKTPYIGVHIRLGDKVNGPDKETEYIDLNEYMNQCIKIRNSTGINTIVICSDTNEALDIMKGYNDQLVESGYRGFNMLWNEDEKRCSNHWTDSVTHRANCNTISPEELEKEYITCFINFQLLLEADILVGNFDSGFILAAVEYRNNGKDINLNVQNPAKWGIANRSGW